MTAYFDSLEKILARNYAALWPTHGPPVHEVRPFIEAYIAHRKEREEQIVAQLAAGRHRIKDIVSIIYADVDKRLHPAACHSVLAHMIRLVELGRVICDGNPCVENEYWLKKAA